ncbi:MAG: hypothetical protein ACT4PZ_13435 [Panacagrimonas sp.]
MQGKFAAYHVILEIVRNGIHLGTPEATVAAGESSRVEVGPHSRPGTLMVQQRVTGFPGSSSSKALLELEFFGSSGGGRSSRIAAPTFGIDLGQSELFEVTTEQGTMSVRATVEGREHAPPQAASGPVGIAYPEI